MFSATLKRLTGIIFVLGCAFFARAQQIHFIYLQTENGQPFYVKLNNDVVSSSSTGYLILPKLVDGEYKLNIGFPKKEFPEEKFQLTVHKKNEGFVLKNFGEKGWELFNMQSYEVVMGSNSNTIDTLSKNLQSDSFSTMLANVVKDSSLLQKDEPAKELVLSPNSSPVAINVQSMSLVFFPVKKLLSKKNSDGMEMVYIDSSQNGNDTIRIFIPAEKAIIKTDTVATSSEPVFNKDTVFAKEASSGNDNLSLKDTASLNNAKQEPGLNTATTAFVATPLVSENKSVPENKDSRLVKGNAEVKQNNEEIKQPVIIQQDSTKKVLGTDGTKKDDVVVLPEVVKSSNTNSDCKAFANDEDFLKLRKKMASENSDDDMIKIAKKVFHSKCFSTEQIKNLSFLFLTNEGKYRFFDEAYAFVSDSNQYFTLQSQLTDSYYINRFRAMIHK